MTSKRVPGQARPPSKRPMIRVQKKPDGRYRLVPNAGEQETVPPAGRKKTTKFEVTRAIKRRLKP